MKIKLAILYTLLIAGGIWNLTGLMQDIMRWMASPLIIGLGIWVFIELLAHIRANEPRIESRFIWWSAITVVITFGLEQVGVHTGILFGHYRYGDVLQPQIASVPVAIGFAWFTMLVSSTAIALKTGKKDKRQSPMMLAVIVAIIMVGFDSLMEPAAVTLGYWQWLDGAIPMLNYYTWFIVSYILVAVALTIDALPRSDFRFGIHAFAAQLAFFALTVLGMMIR